MPVPQYTQEYYRWKFAFRIGGPGGDIAPVGIACEHEDSVIGFACFFPYVGREGRLVWNVDDVVTRRDYRKQGVFKSVMEFGLACLDTRGEDTFLFSSNEAEKGYLRLGYERAYSLDYCILVPSYADLLGTKGYVFRVLGKFVDSVASLRHSSSPWYRYRRVKQFPSEMVAALELSLGRAALKKNAAYLNWRYFGHPLHEYDCYCVEDGRCIVGYLVFCGTNLVDFQVIDENVASDAVLFAMRYFKQRSVLVGNCMFHDPSLGLKTFTSHGAMAWGVQMRPAGLLAEQELLVRKSGKSGTESEDALPGSFRSADIDCGF